jgi:hypothetical protein
MQVEEAIPGQIASRTWPNFLTGFLSFFARSHSALTGGVTFAPKIKIEGVTLLHMPQIRRILAWNNRPVKATAEGKPRETLTSWHHLR